MANDLTPFSGAIAPVAPTAAITPSYSSGGDFRPPTASNNSPTVSSIREALKDAYPSVPFEQHRPNILALVKTLNPKLQGVILETDLLDDIPSLVLISGIAKGSDGTVVDQAKIDEVITEYGRATKQTVDGVINDLSREALPPVMRNTFRAEGVFDDEQSRIMLFILGRMLLPEIKKRASLSPGELQQAQANAARTTAPLPSDSVAIDDEIAGIEQIMRKDRRAYNSDENLQARYRDLLQKRLIK